MSIKTYAKSLLTAFLVLMLSLGAAYAQNTISGKVTGDGEALEGATVIVKGTSIGAFTDENGEFSLSAPEPITTLVVRYVSYKDTEVDVTGKSSVDIDMEADFSVDEVVVTGYGTARAKEVTSAIATVKAEDFNKGLVNNPAQLIQGKVTGLSISRAGNDPNEEFSVRLRGLSSIGQNAEPLVVIDGVIGGSILAVDPNDIQSIDVLKDGSAAAIYGTRASSGVIIITTKRGLPGPAKVEYNGSISAEALAKEVPVMSAQDFVNIGGGADRGSSTDWMDQVTNTAISHVHNISFSGGAQNFSYRASLNIRDAQGVGINTGFFQLNGRVHITQRAFNDKVKFTADLAATTRDSDLGFKEAFRYATVYNPTAPTRITDQSNPFFDKYGGYYQEENFDYFNPLAINEQSINEGQSKRIVGSLKGEWEIIDGLKWGAFYSQQRESDLFGSYYNKQAYFRGFNRNGLARRSTEDRWNELFETTVDYDRDFGGMNFKALLGYSYQDFVTEGFGAEGGNIISDALTYNNLGAAQDFNNGIGDVFSYKNSARLIGFFGRVAFNWNDTWFLTGSLRYEGSSRFGENNKWGTFPGISGGVNLANLFDMGFDNFKLRAGYGVTGALPNESYLSLLRFNDQGSFFFNGEFVSAFGPEFNANPDLKWETKAEFDVGIDFAALNYRLTGTIDYYNRTTNDLLFLANVAQPPNLANQTWVNLDQVALKNWGLEFSIGYKFQKNKFMYEPRLLFSTFNTSLQNVEGAEGKFSFGDNGVIFDPTTSPGAPGLNNNPMVRVKVGDPVGNFWGPVYEGVDEDGQFIFRDIDGDGTTDADGDGIVDEGDKTVIGNGLPDFSIGFNNTFEFGNWDLNLFFRGDFGHELINLYRVFYEPLGSRPSDNKVQTKFFDPNLTAAPQFSSHYVEDASFFGLDNATLGYTFNVGQNSQIDRFRLFVSGQNLFFITSYTGVDPNVRFADVGSSDNGGNPSRQDNPNLLAPGIDRRSTYFRTITLSFGANLVF